MFEPLGSALRLLREEAGLSQRQLAQRCRALAPECRVTQAMLSQWERGAQLPVLAQLGQVLSGLGLDLLDLYSAMHAGETHTGETHGGAATVERSRQRRSPVPSAQLLVRANAATNAHRQRLEHRMAAELHAYVGRPGQAPKPVGGVELARWLGEL